MLAIWCQQNVLSNVWWPLRTRSQEGSSISVENIEKIISLWFNSTLGVIQFISNSSDTEGPWMQFKKPILNRLPILNPLALSNNQITEFNDLFERVSEKPFYPFSETQKDETRIAIDKGIAQILCLPDYGVIRELLSKEPVITLNLIS